jgi:outer membrane protein assembly factor BamA
MHSSSAILRIIMTPNPTINAIDLSGNSMIPKEELMTVLDPLIGKRINAQRGRSAMENLLAIYRDNGYSFARIQSTNFDSTDGTLYIRIDEGVIAYRVVEGTIKSRDWLIWRELTIDRGDVFTVSKAQQSISNILATNLFDQVLLEVRYINNSPYLFVKATERRSELVRMGLRFDNERYLQPMIEFRDDNFLGTSTELGASFAGGIRDQKVVAEAKANRIFNSYFAFDLNAYIASRDIYTYADDPEITSPRRFNRKQIGEYNQLKYGTAFSLGRQVERLGNVTAEYRIEYNQIDSLSGNGFSPASFTLQAIRLLSMVDTQDKYPFPGSGSLMTLQWESATSRVGGEIGYAKILLTYEWFDTYFRYHTLHPKITFGFGDETLPLTQQFSIGGENSFFGLKDDDSHGRQVFIVNLEYRANLPFKLIWDTYARVRYDFGSIWPKQSAISFRNFHHGIGFGFSLDTPIGQANLSVGRSFYIRRDILDQPLSLGPILGYFSIGYNL